MKKKSRFIIFFLLFIILLYLITNGSLSKKEIDSSPCNVNAMDDAKAILKYIAKLSSADIKQAIIGQNCYHGDEITNSNSLDGYNKLIVDLYKKTGKWVSIVGIDYEYMKIYSSQELSNANKVLINHWKKGGLITINLSPLNPWIIDESGILNIPKTWDGPGSPTDLSQVNLKELINPEKPVYKVWKKKLDRIAVALLELQKAGVIVLWRPMQEMNGNWFWWGIASHPNDPSGYIKLYRDMYDYFTNVKKLNNLLWVYSPFGSIIDNNYCKPVGWLYPGDQYVDIIAPTSYDDELNIYNYNIYISMGKPHKPLGMGEYGPKIGGPIAKNGTLDTTNFIKRIKNDYPRIAYWVCWHSYPENCWSIISNQNYNTLMNDPDVITLDKLDWMKK